MCCFSHGNEERGVNNNIFHYLTEYREKRYHPEIYFIILV